MFKPNSKPTQFIFNCLISVTFVIPLSGKALEKNHPSLKNARVALIQDTIKTYPISVKFLSVCCGVPSDSPLKQQIREFKKKYKIKKIKATRIGPLGREGEYDLAFELNGISPARKREFIKRMKKASLQMKDKGKAAIELNAQYDRNSLPARLSVESIEF